MTASSKRLLAAGVGLAVLIAGGLVGFYYWQVGRHQSGPRTTAPAVLVPEYTGPGSLKKPADTPPGEK
ncbi:MAG: hypothetical protein C0501_03630 [Isosphaera sp.]|nr:hypothetical protein [Isosphaera sp.]